MHAMQPIRICQLITTLGQGGAEWCVYELATMLDPARFDVQVVALRGGMVADVMVKAGVKVTVLDVGCRWSPAAWGKVGRLSRLLADERIDLLHTHLFHADLAGRLAAKRAGTPHLVHTVHVAEQRFMPWRLAFARWTRARCDRIIAVSQSVKDSHQAGSRLADVDYTVLPNGRDTDKYSPDADAREWWRQRLGLGEDDIAALYLGRQDRQKGTDVLLKAAKQFLAATPNATLLIAGEGPMQRRVARVCNASGGRARYLGYVDDTEGLLNGADMFVLPSRWEGWPLALGEAMAVGLPAIGADSPGVRDVITAAETGLLVPAEDAVALADAMARLAGDADLRRQLGQAGQQYIRDGFSIAKYISAHEDLYEQIAGQR